MFGDTKLAHNKVSGIFLVTFLFLGVMWYFM